MSAGIILSLASRLRARGIPVGMGELLSLARALALGTHASSFGRFRLLARSLLVHDESKLDDFDLAFDEAFRGRDADAAVAIREIRDWLQGAARSRLENVDLSRIDELVRLLEKRLKEQHERHSGGATWVGTGGASPFGSGGIEGGAIGFGGGARVGIGYADARAYARYRTDIRLDQRQFEQALRKLRAADRESPPTDLDLGRTVHETARNLGEIELVWKPPRDRGARVLLLMDVGGSMDPHRDLVSRLFSAARKAGHWKDLRSYYFHNCVYGDVFGTGDLARPERVREILKRFDPRYRLVVVGDASMAPYELDANPWGYGGGERRSGIGWLRLLRESYPRSVWLNPDGVSSFPGSTVQAIAEIFPMFPLTVEGIGQAAAKLR